MRSQLWRIVLAAALCGSAMAHAGCGGREAFDARLNRAIAPYRFSILRWEIEHLPKSFGTPNLGEITPEQKAVLVRHYFALGQQVREREWALERQRGSERITCAHCEEDELQALVTQYHAMRPTVQRIIAEQLEQALRQEGITNPGPQWLSHQMIFPPVRFALEGPPHVLVISPRDRIESVRETLLLGDLTVAQKESIERQVEALETALAPLGLSALVEEIGGFGGTFPTFVTDDTSLYSAIGIVAEEWLHQYLAFTPLGFLYVLDLLGLARNYEIAKMNETAADIAGRGLRDRVVAAHYPELAPQTAPSVPPPAGDAPSPQPFNYGRFMRETRVEVDRLLAEGQVEEAEAYMEARRLLLRDKGYLIRRLNQAFFAFHGTYAASEMSLDPDTGHSIDPIGEEMMALRAQSGSVGAFVRAASRLTSREALRKALGMTSR